MSTPEPERRELLEEAYLLGLGDGFRMAFEYALASAVTLYLILAITFLNDPYYEHASLLQDLKHLILIPLLILLYGAWIFILPFLIGSMTVFTLLGAATASVIALPLRGSRPWSSRRMRGVLLVMMLFVSASLAAAAYGIRPELWALATFFVLPALFYARLALRIARGIRRLVEEAPSAHSISNKL